MDVDRSSMCASARGGDSNRQGIRRREWRNEREKGKTRGRSHSQDVARQGEKESKEENRGRERKGGGGERGWPFDEHGGPSMDVRRGPWRHTCTSPRHPGESKQPYKVAGLRFNPKFISSISKGLSRGPERVSERLTRTTLPSPTPPRCSPSCLARSLPLLSSPLSLLWERRNARRCTGASQAHHYIMTPISPSLLYPRRTGVRGRV